VGFGRSRFLADGDAVLFDGFGKSAESFQGGAPVVVGLPIVGLEAQRGVAFAEGFLFIREDRSEAGVRAG
jgi:hypothetical protein